MITQPGPDHLAGVVDGGGASLAVHEVDEPGTDSRLVVIEVRGLEGGFCGDHESRIFVTNSFINHCPIFQRIIKVKWKYYGRA
jgi:hypothetical protein